MTWGHRYYMRSYESLGMSIEWRHRQNTRSYERPGLSTHCGHRQYTRSYESVCTICIVRPETINLYSKYSDGVGRPQSTAFLVRTAKLSQPSWSSATNYGSHSPYSLFSQLNFKRNMTEHIGSKRAQGGSILMLFSGLSWLFISR